MGDAVVIAADNGRHDFHVSAEQTAQADAGPDRAFPNLRRQISLVLAANAGKKLIYIVNNAVAHAVPLRSRWYMRQDG